MVEVTKDMSWHDVAAASQKHRASTIAQISPPVPDPPQNSPRNVTDIPRQLLSRDVLEITESPVETLLPKLASGALTATAVTSAFFQRAALACKLVNSATELLPDRAMTRAADLDAHLATHGSPIGPLHGLPISVKEHIAMKGLDLNAGFISWVGNVAPDDGLILKLLWKAGCVFYVRTTEPQTLMHLETDNNIFGTTANPYNTGLTSGGSSGGEGAQMGLRGSCLGIGTDIGGSIRSPAANQGLYGFRPTSYRLPLDGFAATMLGEEHIVPVVGPLSTSLAGIKVFMKAIVDQKPWLYDPMLVPMPWKTEPQLRPAGEGKGRRLRVGILWDDEVVRPHPPILRGLSTLVSRLRSSPQIEVIDFPPYAHDRAWRIISSLYFADGAKQERAAIEASGEPWRPLSEWLIKQGPNVKELSVEEVWGLTAERDAYRGEYARHWNSIGTALPPPSSGNGDAAGPCEGLELSAGKVEEEGEMVDVVLCPAGSGCAPPHGCARYWGYTSQWNLLDYPSLVFPTGLQCNESDAVEKDYTPRTADDEYNYRLYEPEMYKDAPISLQLVGRRYEDEKVVEAMGLISQVAGLPFGEK